ncbi:MAG: hypothetical protein GMKNLPBB_01539 [Myxococcota bacterium]|nr:hypothetical protein [Myxococcota bacterium]
MGAAMKLSEGATLMRTVFAALLAAPLLMVSSVALAQDDEPEWKRLQREAREKEQPGGDSLKQDEEAPKSQKQSQAADGEAQPKEEDEGEKKEEEEGGKKKKKKEDRDWRKGTIYEGRPAISPGSIINPYTTIGATGQLFLLKDRLFIHANPQADIHWTSQFSTGFAVPLNFQIYDASRPIDISDPEAGARKATDGIGSIRKEDWDEISDFAKVIRYIKYGQKMDKFYFFVGNLYAYTIGHGTIVRRYTSTADFDRKTVGVQLDLAIQKDEKDDYAGFELFLSDITFQNRILGGLVFAKPLVWADSEILRSFSVGLHSTFDFNAPSRLKMRFDGRPEVNPDRNALEFDGATVGAIGVDAVIKVVRESWVDIKPYVDYSMLLLPDSPSGNGSGFAGGILNRFKFGSDSPVRFSNRLEGRFFSAQYLPAYFNTYYEIQKYQFFSGAQTPQFAFQNGRQVLTNLPPTKLDYLRINTGGPFGGFYLDGNLEISDWFQIGAAFENSSGNEGGNFLAHLGLTPGRGLIQAFATYHKVNMGMRNPATNQSVESGFLDFKGTDDHVVLTALRVQILPIMWLRAHYSRTWLLETRSYTALDGSRQPTDDRFGFYRTVNSLGVGFEFAIQFTDERADEDDIKKSRRDDD